MLKLKTILILISLSLIIALGLKFRFRSYNVYPPIGENFDEQVLVWVGSSLINNGVPTGWSFIDDYKSNNKGHLVNATDWGINIDGRKPKFDSFFTFPKPLSHDIEMTLDGYTTQFTLVQPQVEQPPLGPLLASFLSGSFKKANFELVTLKEMRISVILFSVISMVCIFLISYLSFGMLIGLLSALIYALTPIIIISSRLVTAENYLTPLLLLGVLFTQLWIMKEKNLFLFLASFLIMVCYLIKPFGISLGGVVFLAILAFNKPKKYLIFPAVFSILGILTFFAYGNFYAPKLFPKIVAYQVNRLYSPLEGILKIIIPKITKIFLDGWIIFGWLSIAALAFQRNFKKYFWIISPVLSLLFMFTLYGGQDYGWYRLPIYPFLSIATSVILMKGIRQSQPWVGITFLITVFTTSLWWGFFGLTWNSVVLPFRLVMVSIFLFLLLGFINSTKMKVISSLTLIILILITFWLNTKTINNTNLFWPTLREATLVWPAGK